MEAYFDSCIRLWVQLAFLPYRIIGGGAKSLGVEDAGH
ncbi:hypothetical protein H6P1_00134 (plasmid) [Variovorax sp. PBL-H6]|nr:hypothetical protein H6P1_00134 [Variovorax sp. PBL-H6]VTU44151.1 hypothetical protein SRS16P1_00768 [Variovorax sp. SRS16]VTU44232.1 hypothetical protein E5P1_00761 [Variovorax sp. PBL-E5]